MSLSQAVILCAYTIIGVFTLTCIYVVYAVCRLGYDFIQFVRGKTS